MKYILNNITDGEFAILDQITQNPGLTPADLFFDDPTIDGRIQMLTKHKLITLNSEDELFVTELGRSALVEYDIIQKINQKEHRSKLIEFWIPTTISLISLAVSIIALMQ